MNVEKEYGGYLEIERARGEEYYPNLTRLNLGRTALVWLLSHIEHTRIFIPRFICDTVTESVLNAGYSVATYYLDEKLNPIWGEDGEPGENDIFYLVNFFGQLKNDEVENCKRKYSKLIVDNAQSFYDSPLPDTHTLYSARKFFGVADGAYVSSSIKPADDELEYDRSAGRAEYLVGRLEGSANEFYSKSKSAELAYSFEIPKRMSLFTQNILKGVDYSYIQEKRCRNYSVLRELLPGDNPFNRKDPICPYVFPYYHKDGINLRKYLIEKKIYIPVLWSYLIEEEPEDRLEHEWSANILSLPIDQRYNEEDMRYIADVIKSYS